MLFSSSNGCGAMYLSAASRVPYSPVVVVVVVDRGVESRRP
jgi:hypothetical protein